MKSTVKFLAGTLAFTFLIATQQISEALPVTSRKVGSPQPDRLTIPLKGEVTENVPKTPEAVGRYLLKMRSVLDEYQELVANTLIGGGSIINSETVGSARDQFVDMIKTIRSITPPEQLHNRHYQLASTLANVEEIIANPGAKYGNAFVALQQLGPLVNQMQETLNSYHTGVKNCLAYYHLGPEYDPLGGNHSQTQARLGAAFNQMQQGVLSGQQGHPESMFSSSSYPSMNATTNHNSTPAAGSFDLKSLGLGNMDPAMAEQLGSLLQGAQGGSGGGLGSLLQGGQGGSGSGLGSLLQGAQGGSEFGQEHSNNSSTPSAGQLQQLLQQLQGQ